MPLVMQLDGPRPAPQLLGIWSDIWTGIETVGDAITETASDAWSSITDRRLKPMRIGPARMAPSAAVHGPFDVVMPSTISLWIPLLLGVGAGIFLATRKGKKR